MVGATECGLRPYRRTTRESPYRQRGSGKCRDTGVREGTRSEGGTS
ncbi:MAG: hypothetical protein MJE68_05865 [Proteobacteria bacterium]|nr:hypothetical protein [Pseudomonadota bacterium]